MVTIQYYAGFAECFRGILKEHGSSLHAGDRTETQEPCPAERSRNRGRVQDVVDGYFDELERTRSMLDSRHDDLKSGRVAPLDGEEFFERLRVREDELIEKQSPQ